MKCKFKIKSNRALLFLKRYLIMTWHISAKTNVIQMFYAHWELTHTKSQLRIYKKYADKFNIRRKGLIIFILNYLNPRSAKLYTIKLSIFKVVSGYCYCSAINYFCFSYMYVSLYRRLNSRRFIFIWTISLWLSYCMPYYVSTIIRQWLLPQYCGTKGPIGYFHQTNQNSGFQTVAATLEMLLPPNQSASV